MGPNIAMLAGEISGDLVGGALAREIRALCPDVDLWGTGSARMADAEVELLFDSAEWGAIGILQAVQLYPRFKWHILPRVQQELLRRRPALTICIDFGAFNVFVAGWCKRHGLRVLYYVPPGSWKRQGKASPALANAADLIVTPFDWSVERYTRAGGNVKFLGHPLLDVVRPSMTRAEFASKFGLEPGKPIVGLLPGSRRYEIEYNTPAMVEAAKKIRAEIPDAQFVFGISSSTPRESIERWLSRAPSEHEHGHGDGGLVVAITTKIARLSEKLLKRSDPHFVTPEGVQVPASAVRKQEARERARRARECADPPPTVIASGITYDVQAHSDVLLCCSGTATLEAAILGTPMVILYRIPRWMEVEGRLRRLDKRIVHMGLPNIIADKRIVPELLQDEASPEALAANALKLLTDPVARAETKTALARIRESLGSPGASKRAAELAVEIAGIARAK